MTPEYQALREAVARALCAADGYDPDSAPAAHPTAARWRSYRDSADAALRVVREALQAPTHEMQAAAEREAGVFGAAAGPRIYAAMLAASALGGGDE